jgi:predicted nucleic acid-binding protein
MRYVLKLARARRTLRAVMTIPVEIIADMQAVDCLYVALAEREGCELVTPDQRLVNALQSRYPFITPLSALP